MTTQKHNMRTHTTIKTLLAAAASFALTSVHADDARERCESQLKDCERSCDERRNWCVEPFEEWKRHMEEQCENDAKSCRDECNGHDDPGLCIYERCTPARNDCQRDIDNWYSWNTGDCDREKSSCVQDCYRDFWTCS
jgi:hypothetical protein